jgi:hypothetical protein
LKGILMSEVVLFANGCSMSYGSGLFEDTATKLCFDNTARLISSWPGVLGRELGFHRVVNISYPGSSNDRIVRTTISWILEHWIAQSKLASNIFVVIGWSGPMRREFYINGDWRQLIPYHDYIDTPASLLNRVYREVAWSEYESAIRFATQIITLQEFFRSYKIPYLFFDAITSFVRTNLDSNNALDAYLPHIDRRNYFHLGDEIGAMATQVGRELDGVELLGHPTEADHAEWAYKLANFVQERRLCPPLVVKTMMNAGPPVVEGTGTVEILDSKIGLSRQAPSDCDFHRLQTLSDSDLPTNTIWKKGFFQRIRRAWQRDPFIYE